MSAEVSFPRRTGFLLSGAALVSLLCAFWLLMTPSRQVSIEADGYSRSAIGHFGLLQLLKELGEPVIQLRQPRPLRGCGLYVIAEPSDHGPADALRLEAVLEETESVLIVLPKRTGLADQGRPEWIQHDRLLTIADAAEPLRTLLRLAAADTPELARHDEVTAWRNEHDWPVPELPGPVQLMERKWRFDPIVECEQGVLLARRDNVYVLSDPDLIANHGLVRGDNAALVIDMLRHMNLGGSYVFDESTHGHRDTPDIFEEMGRFPALLLPVHLLVLIAVTLWIACGRFGAPRALPPELGAGKAFLIDNIANLLRRGDDPGAVLRRYCRMRVRAAAERLHAPAGLNAEQCSEWLLRHHPVPERSRELGALLQTIPKVHDRAPAVAAARRVHELTEENPHVVS